MPGTLLDALHSSSNSDLGDSPHCCSNQCFLLTRTTEGEQNLNFTSNNFARWLTCSYTHGWMDITGRKYEEIWKGCQRRHNGFEQRNQMTHSEYLCTTAICQVLGPSEKDNSAPESDDHSPSARVWHFSPQKRVILRKTMVLTIRKLKSKA